MWKAWFILAWLSILTGKLLYLATISAKLYYCTRSLSMDPDEVDYCKARNGAQIFILTIMIIVYIATGLWIINTFPDT